MSNACGYLQSGIIAQLKVVLYSDQSREVIFILITTEET